ncbi:ANTAR domain-containing protein [Streptomyces sp. NPDC046832]|uniref:ANTAR domain-containing protein n=1 Tax=Streptomyces sp. NPDC046832 TaxID=3155020 RepID=UPI0033C265E6
MQDQHAGADPPSADAPQHAGGGSAEPDAEQIARLRDENEQLKQAMESRPRIDMPRRILIAQLGCSVEESWEILVEVSQRSNIRLRVVAERMMAAVMRKEPFCCLSTSPGNAKNTGARTMRTGPRWQSVRSSRASATTPPRTA